MKRFPGAVLLATFLAVPAFARVISYSPYTNQVAEPAVQSRTARHFVLLEGEPKDYQYRSRSEVVLYDSTGAEEPRVITPAPGVYYQSALYQKEGEAPVILLLGGERYYQQSLWIGEGGTSWRKVAGGPTTYDWVANLDVDTGGPFANGLFAPIVIGNDAWPFVVTIRGKGVWAIRRDGTARQLFDAGARVIGRNAAGNRFLVHHEGAIWSRTVDRPAVRLATAAPNGLYAGWITSKGIAYVELLSHLGRYLFTTGGGALQFVDGDRFEPPAIPYYPSTSLPLRFFAVPMHDYEGAWIVRRSGTETSLLRHTPTVGLRLQWTDRSAPQIEALIAGASGRTVLVQVHRERKSAQLDRPFLDPALAVWRVGKPAPREYEELYLNENWNKGFVIVDPDTIESGAPFVFNSGFVEIVEEPVSRVSAPIGGGSDVMQEWGVVRASFQQRLVLPGVARLRGAYGSFWQTDLTVYNPLAEPQDVEVRFVPLGAQEPFTTTLTLEPREIRAIGDVLGSLFSVADGGGTLHLLPAAGINATARTYSRRSDGGTFGFGMQAIDFFNAAGPRFPISFAGAFPGEHFRTNLLVTDTSGRGANVSLRGSGVQGSVFGDGTFVDTRARTTVQVNSVSGTLAMPANASGGLLVTPTSGTAIATVVVIDNRSNDPTYFPPDLPGSVPRAIPLLAHVDGPNGANLRTDLYLYNPRNTTRTVDLVVRSWSSSAVRAASYTLWPGETRVIKDALAQFGIQGFAHLTFSNPLYQTGDAVRVTSRTYTIDANGATYGCLVPPLNGFQIAAEGDVLEILGISAGPGFRTNIGLVHLDNASVRPTVRLTIVGDRGEVLISDDVQIPARGGIEIADVFDSIGRTPPPAALLRIEVLGGDRVAAYATLTDNVTSDSVYLGAQLGAKPEPD
jgi:hypothetical protein